MNTDNFCPQRCPACGGTCLGLRDHLEQTKDSGADQHACDRGHVWRTGALHSLRLVFSDTDLADLGDLIRDMPPELRLHFHPLHCRTPFDLHALAAKALLLDEENKVSMTPDARERVVLWAQKLEATQSFRNEYDLKIGRDAKLLLEMLEGTPE
jgi:hypothetical protein